MIIHTENLHKTYGRHAALRGLNLAVTPGSAYALIGANGAGKSTTIRTLMNIIEPSSGSATVLGIDSRQLSSRELAQIGYVADGQELPGRLTVGQYRVHGSTPAAGRPDDDLHFLARIDRH